MTIELERMQTRCRDLEVDVASKQSAYEALQADNERIWTAFEKQLAQQREHSTQQISELRRENEAAEAKAAEQSAIANQACNDLANTKTELIDTQVVLDQVTKERDAATHTVLGFDLAVTRNDRNIDTLKYNLDLLSDQGKKLLEYLAAGYESYIALSNDNIRFQNEIAAGYESYAAVYNENIHSQNVAYHLWNQRQEREAEIEDLNHIILDERKRAKVQAEESAEYEQQLNEVIWQFEDDLDLARQKNAQLIEGFRRDHETPFEDRSAEDFNTGDEEGRESEDVDTSGEEASESYECNEEDAEGQKRSAGRR